MNIELGDEHLLWYTKCLYIRGYKFFKGLLLKTDKSIKFIGKYRIIEIEYKNIIETKMKRFICIITFKILIEKGKYLFTYISRKCKK